MEITTAGDGIAFTVRANAPLRPELRLLSGPRRLVCDFPGFVLGRGLAGWERDLGDSGFLGRARLGQYLPDVARLVVEVTGGASYKLLPAGEEVTLTLRRPEPGGRLVALDPGHGGSDPGAIGPTGLREKDVNLAIATCLARLLESSGVRVLLTRSGDEEVGLQERAARANAAGADVFVSIHANASVNPATGGTSTYTYTAREKEARLFLARLVQEELVAATGLRNIGVLEEGFAVLKYTQIPAVLVEVAFISNPAEERLLADPGFQERVAAALARALERFFVEGVFEAG